MYLTNPKLKEQPTEYSPKFLSIIERNKQFVLTRETLNQIIDECVMFYRGRKTFREWLGENKLEKIECNGVIKIKKTT